MLYSQNQQEYIKSVGGEAHASAVQLIGQLDLEIERFRWMIMYALNGPADIDSYQKILVDTLNGGTGATRAASAQVSSLEPCRSQA